MSDDMTPCVVIPIDEWEQHITDVANEIGVLSGMCYGVHDKELRQLMDQQSTRLILHYQDLVDLGGMHPMNVGRGD